MAFDFSNTAEGGSDGVTVTPGNSGGLSGDAFDIVTIPAGNTLTFDNDHAAHGGLSYKFDHPDAAISALRVVWSETTAEVFGRLYFWKANIPNAFLDLFGGYPSGSSLRRASVGLTSAGFVALADDDSGPILTGAVLPAYADWNRLEFHFVAHPTAGLLEVSLYKGPEHDKETADETLSWSGRNTGASFEDLAFGYPSGASGSIQQGPTWLDDLNVNDSSEPGPVPSVIGRHVFGMPQEGFTR